MTSVGKVPEKWEFKVKAEPKPTRLWDGGHVVMSWGGNHVVGGTDLGLLGYMGSYGVPSGVMGLKSAPSWGNRAEICPILGLQGRNVPHCGAIGQKSAPSWGYKGSKLPHIGAIGQKCAPSWGYKGSKLPHIGAICRNLPHIGAIGAQNCPILGL